MVRILNGEIVQDNDPRLKSQSQQPSQSIPKNAYSAPSSSPQTQSSQSSSTYQNSLLGSIPTHPFGLKDLKLGNYTFTPLQYIFAGLMILFFGFNGAIAVVILYVITRNMDSTNNTSNNNTNNNHHQSNGNNYGANLHGTNDSNDSNKSNSVY